MAEEIKLIMSDLDGTLLNDDNELTEENKAALTRAHDMGIGIVPVSARFFSAIKDALKDLDVADYVVCCNGASFYDYKKEECLFMDEMNKDTVINILSYLDTVKCVQYAVVNGDCYTDRPSFEKYYDNMFVPIAYRQTTGTSFLCDDLKELVKKEDSRVEIIFVIFPDREATLAADKVIRGFGDLATLGAFPTDLEISNASATKESIILKMKDILGIDTKNIMAFGDGDNDSGMIKNAGIGIAMENGMDKTKKAARYITKKNVESGVAYMVNKYLDGELE